jgi:NADPH:quinone reductase-like Zn-dependent oxidoreductase
MTAIATRTSRSPGSGNVPATMRAIVRDRYGDAGALRIETVPLPAPGPGEVLVCVCAAGLDRGAWHILEGKPYLARLAFGLRRPRSRFLGNEVAGVVEAVGRGVTRFAPGDRVFGCCRGGFAEYVAVKEARLAPLPATLTFEQAAAVPISGITALDAVHTHGRVAAGQHVLVIGASGGVGSFAVQIAKAAGARVTAVSSAAKAALVRDLGADRVIAYEHERIGDAGERFDLILDIGGNRSLRELRRSLTPRGTLLIVGGERNGPWTGGLDRQLGAVLLSPFVRQRLGMFVAKEDAASLERLRALIEAGQLRPQVDRVVPLDGLPEAMRDLAAGRVRGKAVVAI